VHQLEAAEPICEYLMMKLREDPALLASCRRPVIAYRRPVDDGDDEDGDDEDDDEDDDTEDDGPGMTL